MNLENISFTLHRVSIKDLFKSGLKHTAQVASVQHIFRAPIGVEKTVSLLEKASNPFLGVNFEELGASEISKTLSIVGDADEITCINADSSFEIVSPSIFSTKSVIEIFSSPLSEIILFTEILNFVN
jgi:hypothetical protein